MTALELAIKWCDHEQEELHNNKGAIKCKNSMNTWYILSDYLSMTTSSIVDVLIYIICCMWTISAISTISINMPNHCGHFAPPLVKFHCLPAFIC
jgi:hypothetical protein